MQTELAFAGQSLGQFASNLPAICQQLASMFGHHASLSINVWRSHDCTTKLWHVMGIAVFLTFTEVSLTAKGPTSQVI